MDVLVGDVAEDPDQQHQIRWNDSHVGGRLAGFDRSNLNPSEPGGRCAMARSLRNVVVELKQRGLHTIRVIALPQDVDEIRTSLC